MPCFVHFLAENSLRKHPHDFVPPVYKDLLQRIPCALDFYWWSHSVAGLDPEEVEPGSFGIRIWNSWTDGWSENGTAVLRGDKALPNGAVATRGVPATAE